MFWEAQMMATCLDPDFKRPGPRLATINGGGRFGF